jgi:5-methylcytosine-specific restriction endonuclease McrA
VTTRLGFVNVIDAFHVVGPGEIPVRFFVDEHKISIRGIRFTEPLLELVSTGRDQALAEIESRWKLVETARSLELNRSLIAYEEETGLFIPSVRRQPLTSARSALSGYQKRRCFYCFRPISIVAASPDLGDVDHLFPHILQRLGIVFGLDQVWNLVLACQECNRGARGKFAAVPDRVYVQRLSRHNEYLIGSHHPLRETLISCNGLSCRRDYLDTPWTNGWAG